MPEFQLVWPIVLFYFALMLAVGLLASRRKVGSMEDMTVAGRRAGPFLIAFSVAATWIYYRGRQSLGWKTMMGIRGKFVATGVYRYTRNPMYVGDIALCMGFALICNSLLVHLVAAIAAILFFFTPFAEEPWLRDRYGTAYDEYMVKVPRFVPSFRHCMKHEA